VPPVVSISSIPSSTHRCKVPEIASIQSGTRSVITFEGEKLSCAIFCSSGPLASSAPEEKAESEIVRIPTELLSAVSDGLQQNPVQGGLGS